MATGRLLLILTLACVASGHGLAQQASPSDVLARQLADAEALRARGTASSLREARVAMEAALQAAEVLRDEPKRATALTGLGRTLDALGDGARAVDLLTQAVDVYAALGARENEAWARNYGSLALDRLGKRQDALEWLNRALPLAREAQAVRAEGITLNNLGMVHSNLGDRRKALELYNQAIDRHRASGNFRRRQESCLSPQQE